MKTPAFRGGGGAGAGGWSPREGPPSHPAWGWPSPALAGRPQVGCLGLPAGLGGRGGTRPTWGTWRRLRSSEEPKVAPFSLQPDRRARGVTRARPSEVSPGLRLWARCDPGPSALPSLPGTRGRPRLPPAPEARRGVRSAPGRLPRPWKVSLHREEGPRRSSKRILQEPGLGRAGHGGCCKPAALGQGVLGKGRQRRHSPGTWSRAGSRQIFVLGTACMALFLLMVWFVE